MKPKHKALLLNFLGFAIIFLVARFSLNYFFEINRFLMAFISAVIAMLLSPKFAVIMTESGEKVSMKWFFSKKN